MLERSCFSLIIACWLIEELTEDRNMFHVYLFIYLFIYYATHTQSTTIKKGEERKHMQTKTTINGYIIINRNITA